MEGAETYNITVVLPNGTDKIEVPVTETMEVDALTELVS